MNILIVGCGNIGSKLYSEYALLKPDRYDPYKNIDEKKDIEYDIAFIAVDTPMNTDGACDLSQVKAAVNETKAKIIVLRSTVPPGTTAQLIAETKKRIVFMPEFYGRTQHCDERSFNFQYAIIGGDRNDCKAIVHMLQQIYDARFRFCLTDSTTAELSKYMMNTFLAARVSLCVQFWEIAKQFGVDYTELREIWLQDERMCRAHTFVYEDKPFWDSHCFNKDLPAITNFSNAPLIQSIIDYNNMCRKHYGGESDGQTQKGN